MSVTKPSGARRLVTHNQPRTVHAGIRARPAITRPGVTGSSHLTGVWPELGHLRGISESESL